MLFVPIKSRAASTVLCYSLFVMSVSSGCEAPSGWGGRLAPQADLLAALSPSSYSSLIAIRTHYTPSPDGRYVVYHVQRPVLDEGGFPKPPVDGHRVFQAAVYVADVDGRNERILFDDADQHAQEPRWSPDGSWIALVAGTGYGPGDHTLRVIRPKGTEGRIVARAEAGLIKSPSWSADSRRLAFNVRNPEAGWSHIHVIDLDGTQERVLTEGQEGLHDHPRWSPDGKHLLVSWEDAEGEEGGLYQVSLDNPADLEWIIPPGPGQERMAAWSREQDLVFFVRFGVEENAGDVMMRDIATGREWNVTQSPTTYEWFPTVSYDGATLFYSDGVFSEDGTWIHGKMVRKPMRALRALMNGAN